MSDKRRAYLAWMTVCVVWGTTYAAIRICLESIPPFLMGGLRWTAAGGLILLVLRFRGRRLPPPTSWIPLALLGLLMVGLGNGGVVWAERTLASGLTAVIVASAPFWMVGLEALMPDGERLTLRRVAGLLVGFVGIVYLLGPEIRLGGDVGFFSGVLAAQIACAGWAVGSVYARRRGRDEHLMAGAAFQMVFGGLFMFGAGIVKREWDVLAFNPRTTAAFLYLIFVGSIAGFSSYLYALRHLPVSTVSLYTYVNPVIAVVLGTWLFREPLTWRLGVAGTVILAGMAMVQRQGSDSPKKKKAEAEKLNV
jgi:drug/metabolite transporter (DMT)-like permease